MCTKQVIVVNSFCILLVSTNKIQKELSKIKKISKIYLLPVPHISKKKSHFLENVWYSQNKTKKPKKQVNSWK